MQPKRLKGKFWKSGADPVDLDVEFLATGVLRVDLEAAEGDGLVFIETESGRSYALGEWVFKAGRGSRPDLLAATDLAGQAGGISIERSALNRLHGLLQRDPTLTLQIRQNDRVIEASVVPVSSDNPSAIFMGALTEAVILSGRDTIVVADVLGMAFTFKARVLEQEGTTVVMTLPSAAVRSTRRFTNRSSRPISIFVEGPIETEGTVANHSTLGLAVNVGEKASSFSIGDEIRFRFSAEDAEPIHSHAMVVATASDKIHLLLAGGEASVKERFYALMGLSQENLKFEESPSEAWECLDRFKYLDLIEGRVLEQVKTDCIHAWETLREDYRAFQPVAKFAGEPVGTIGAIQVTSDHWVPHSLATKVDPALINVTSSLYMSWPNYLLSLAKPLWMSTWYDANKKWHNRFYQVFIKEHERDPDVVTFVRQLLVAPKLIISEVSPVKIELIEVDHLDGFGGFEIEWKQRYGNMIRSPALNLEPRKEYVFEERGWLVRCENKSIGIIKTLNSSLDVNPFSVLQIAHINLFDANQRQKSKVWQSVLLACSRVFNEEGKSHVSITLDYDAPVDELELKETGFALIGEARCLCATSRMLPGLMSNNVLSFADMAVRNRAA